jgi:Undecaprenyl-phosphate glucose phosphotransferase
MAQNQANATRNEMVEINVRDLLKDNESLPRPAVPVERKLSDRAARIAAEEVMSSYSPVVIMGLFRTIEVTLIFSIGLAVYLAHVWPEYGFLWVMSLACIALPAMAVAAFQGAGLYNFQVVRSVPSQAARLFVAWTAVFAFALAGIFFSKAGDHFSRLWLGLWYSTGLAAVFGLRILLAARIDEWSRQGRLKRRTVIVGGGQAGLDLVRSIRAQGESDIALCGFFDDRTDDRSMTELQGLPKLGDIDDLLEFARQTRVDLIIVTLPFTAEQRVLDMMRKMWVLPTDIRLAAHTAKLRFRPRAYSYIGQVPVLDVFDRPIADWDHVMKYFLDKVVGTLALIALSPVLLITAIAIKLDSKGPVFFKQKRYGFNNEMIEVFKFRSMHVGELDATAAKLVTKGDPRVTRVGRFIRKTSIDELPQLINVVFYGNLSLVGPRPHAVHAKAANTLYNEVVDGYFARHKVKPGITGWAQVNGWRGETDTPDKIQHRVEHDLFYIENWSLLFDLYILCKTPISLISHSENAY